jgi:hypothetical protein
MARIVCHAVRLASGKLPVTFNEAVWSPASQELLRQFGYEMEVDYGVLNLPLSYRGRPALSANELKGLGHWLNIQRDNIRRSRSGALEAFGELFNNLKKSGRDDSRFKAVLSRLEAID